MIYMVLCDTRVSLPVAVSSMGFSKSPFVRLIGAEEVATAALASCRVVFDPIRPPTPIGGLHSKVLRKKRNKRGKCPY
jgi:hypothetical protein